MLPNVQQATIQPIIADTVTPGSLVHSDEYDIYARLPSWGFTGRSKPPPEAGEFASPLVEGAAADIEVIATTVRPFLAG
jgi:hypothetical protein